MKKDDQLALQVSSKEDEIRKYQDKVSEHEVRIGQLNLEKCNYMDIIKQLEVRICQLEKDVAKRETWVIQL